MSLKEVPLGGLCLSAFLIVRDSSGRTLLGKINPGAPWDHIGALDSGRIEIYRKGWMLPSSHLIVHESPQAALRRIASEQLEIQDLPISEPRVITEVYRPRNFADLDEHWDIEFISFASCETGSIPEHTLAFAELRMFDPRTMKRSEIARSHDDVLESAGVVLPDMLDL